ncbi:MAG: type II secretion system protein [Thermodesulfobacteriota bacterium]
MKRRLADRSGFSLIEMIVTMAILSILAAGILPLTTVTYKRMKELELRQNLRTIRRAIDKYKELVDEQRIQLPPLSSGYPKDLELLVEGAEVIDGTTKMKMKFLRRIPRDPMMEDGEWGMRSHEDEPDSDVWGGQDVFDVYSKSDQQALDGSFYRDW